VKRPVRWLLIAAGAVLALVVLLLIFKDALLTVWVRHRLESVTGMKTELRRAHWGLAPAVVSLEDCACTIRRNSAAASFWTCGIAGGTRRGCVDEPRCA
jgi:hypothetical protein